VHVVPPDAQNEHCASLGYAAPPHVSGDARSTTRGPSVFASTGVAALDLVQPIALRTGARWLGDRVVVEIDGDLWLYGARATAPAWALQGVRIEDASTASVNMTSLPSRASARTSGAIRAAVDVELVDGFLWATVGYAFRTAGTDLARLSPTFGALASHTAALGLEATAGGYTITLGWSHAWAVARTPATTAWALDNPFAAGDRAVSLGTYSGATEMVGIAVDAEFAK
jgi:hypothetical protein